MVVGGHCNKRMGSCGIKILYGTLKASWSDYFFLADAFFDVFLAAFFALFLGGA